MTPCLEYLDRSPSKTNTSTEHLLFVPRTGCRALAFGEAALLFGSRCTMTASRDLALSPATAVATWALPPSPGSLMFSQRGARLPPLAPNGPAICGGEWAIARRATQSGVQQTRMEDRGRLSRGEIVAEKCWKLGVRGNEQAIMTSGTLYSCPPLMTTTL